MDEKLIPVTLARNVLKRFEALESRRLEWEGMWQQCSDYVLPRSGQRNKKNAAIFDSTAPLALGRFASALESMLTPRTQKWHGLVTGDPELDRDPDVAAWLEALRDLVFSLRYAPEANFANQMMECYLSLGVHGTAVMYIDDNLGVGPRYKCIPIHECYLAADAAGHIDTVFRGYKLTAAQALEEFGDELPDSIKKDAGDPGRMDEEHDFLHGVFPRRDHNRSKADVLNMPIASVHVARSAGKIVRHSGYRTMPYAISRFYVEPGGVYGRSPAMDAMPDILMVNAMAKTMIRAAQVMVNPPLLIPAEDDVLRAFSLKAGSLNYGGLDDQNRQRVVPLQLGGNLPIGLEMINRSRETINEAYFLTLFQVLLERTGNQTATEVIERAKERAQLLAPTMGRQQAEMLRVGIERELDIIMSAGAIPAGPDMPGLLPPPPEALLDGNGRIEPRYTTEIVQALAAADGTSIMRAAEGLGMLAQLGMPEALDNLKPDAAAKFIMDSNGVPAKAQRSDAELRRLREQRAARQEQEAQARMMSQGLAEAGALAETAKTGAEAEAIQAAMNNGGLQ